MVMEMSMESLFAVVDVFFVSQLGATAVATVGLTESMLTIVYSVAMALCIGATATVARRIGEKDAEGASIAAVQVIAVGLLVSVVLGIVGSLNARWLLAKMGADAAVLGPSATFSVIMLGGSGSVMMLFLMNAIFRAAGDATIAMRVLWLANAINLVLDPCLIFGLGPFPELGVVGAAVATTTGREHGGGGPVGAAVLGRRRIAVAARHLKLVPAAMWTVCRLSGTGLLQILISTSSWIGLVRVISMFGSPALAGYTIGIRTILFALLPSWGLANAAATMVGQGAGRGEAGACGAGGVDGLPLQSRVPRQRSARSSSCSRRRSSASTRAIRRSLATRSACLRIVSLGFVFYAFGMVLTQSFNGAGDTWTPTWINIGCFWLWEIPLAWLLALHLGFGPTGVYIAVMIAFSTVAVVSAVLFRRGRWKVKRV